MKDAHDEGLDPVGSGTYLPTPGFSSATDFPDEQCVHFWTIETPNGPTSQGICKHCGKVQWFRNSVTSSTWNRGMARREGEWL